jgi:serine/threonine protein kinase
MAPEILNADGSICDEYHLEPDVWSGGVIFYELCTLALPFNPSNGEVWTLCSLVFEGKYSPIDESRYSK